MLLSILVIGASLVLDWNEGVSHYEAGESDEALRILRPLMLDREYGPRAAEIVAKIENDRGEKDEAAAAAQIALRAHPKDERLSRNFALAAANLAEYKENKHIEEVLKSAAGQDPGESLRKSWYECRDLLEEVGKLSSKSAEEQVKLSTDFAGRAEKLVDDWIPVRAAISQSVTNEHEAATILSRLDEASSATRCAAVKLSDIELGDAYVKLGEVGDDFKSFLKLVAMPPLALEEDYNSETNKNFEDALDFTRVFRSKFPSWAKEYQAQSESNTNQPPFTAEAQAKISALATELEQLQIDLKENERKLEIIKEIRELMPKNGGQNGGQGQGQGEGQEKREGQEDNQGEEKSPAPQAAEDSPSEDSSVEAVLQKAEERSKEYEDKKKGTERSMKLAPNERDW